LAHRRCPNFDLQEQRNSNLALGISEEPYTKYITSEGSAHKDLYAINLETGDKKMIVKGLRCNPRISPAGKYIAWWSDPDSAWFAWNAQTATIARLTDNRTVPFFNEENDLPDYPNEHGLAGWLEDDGAVLVYDKYDIWKIDPNGKGKPERLTQGRESKTTYRYIKLDPEERAIQYKNQLLLHHSNDSTKAEGYAWLDLNDAQANSLGSGRFCLYPRTFEGQECRGVVVHQGELSNVSEPPVCQF
jgi:hypothetical protein